MTVLDWLLHSKISFTAETRSDHPQMLRSDSKRSFTASNPLKNCAFACVCMRDFKTMLTRKDVRSVAEPEAAELLPRSIVTTSA